MTDIQGIVFIFILCVSCLGHNHLIQAVSVTTSRAELSRNEDSDFSKEAIEVKRSSIDSDKEETKDESITDFEEADTHKLRHSRYHRIDDIIKKISKMSDIGPREFINVNFNSTHNSKISPRKQMKSEGDFDDEYDHHFSTTESWLTMEETTDNRIIKSDLSFNIVERHSDETVIEDEDDGFDDYDDDNDYEDETIDRVKILPKYGESRSQSLDELYTYYISTGRWPGQEPESNTFTEGPGQDYDQNWESQADGNGDAEKDIKWKYYGSRKHIENPRRYNKSKKEDMRQAVEHTVFMTREGICKTPQRRIVSIQSKYPSTSKTYTPRCTFLHHCGDDTGCCSIDSSCVPKHVETVELYFYTTTVGREDNKVEKLRFINHTECECKAKRVDLMVEDETSYILPMSPSPTLTSPSSTLMSPSPSFPEIVEKPEVETEAPMPLKRCHCPSEYSVINTEDGDCECDCYSRQRRRDCLRIKKGKEHFGLKDRLCIQEGVCQTPNCEFGTYNQRDGKCPKKQDKNEETPKHPRIFG